MKIKHFCIDCKKEIKSYTAKRCRPCYVKWFQIPKNNPMFGIKLLGNKNGNFKGGICTKQYYCSDCGKRISISSGVYRTGKCNSCGIKGEKNHFYVFLFQEY